MKYKGKENDPHLPSPKALSLTRTERPERGLASMKYTVLFTKGGGLSDCKVAPSPFPGFIEVTNPYNGTEHYNIAQIKSLLPESGEEESPTGKLERIIRELEGESD